MDITSEIRERPEKLHKKYSAMGQDMVSYPYGLLFADFFNLRD